MEEAFFFERSGFSLFLVERGFLLALVEWFGRGVWIARRKFEAGFILLFSLSDCFSLHCYRGLESGHELIGFLAASLTVSFVSEILARLYKMPATIFVMPGIIPLVPGVGLYRSMLCLVRNDIDGFLSTGVRTMFISGIIAVAIAVVNTAARQIFAKRPYFPTAPHKSKDSNRNDTA